MRESTNRNSMSVSTALAEKFGDCTYTALGTVVDVGPLDTVDFVEVDPVVV